MNNCVKNIVNRRRLINETESRIKSLQKYVDKVKEINPEICTLEEEEEINELEIELKELKEAL